MASDDSEENARRITESINEAAERCIPQSKAGHKPMKHTPLPYWNEHCKTAVYSYARNRARNKLNKKEQMKTLKIIKGSKVSPKKL